jgi:Glycosyl transferase family 2
MVCAPARAAFSSASVLPVSVLIPTRNSLRFLPGHLATMRGWLDEAEEIIVVDSDSCDGTLEFLRAELAGYNVRFLSHPPGLYQSWNFGIVHVRTPYTYISTVGDTITRPGLEHLIELMDRFDSDVVISPPRFIHDSGRFSRNHQWPIHWLIETAGITAPRQLSATQAFLVTALFAPSGLLGSSASNLYRTSLLQRHPFSTDYGHCGDSAWTVRHALRTRWVITPSVLSDFVLHGSHEPISRESRIALQTRYRGLAAESWSAFEAEQLDLGSTADGRDLYHRLDNIQHDLLPLEFDLGRIRTGPVPWIIIPRAWRLRRHRNFHRRRLREIAAAIATMGSGGDTAKDVSMGPSARC